MASGKMHGPPDAEWKNSGHKNAIRYVHLFTSVFTFVSQRILARKSHIVAARRGVFCDAAWHGSLCNTDSDGRSCLQTQAGTLVQCLLLFGTQIRRVRTGAATLRNAHHTHPSMHHHPQCCVAHFLWFRQTLCEYHFFLMPKIHCASLGT